MSTLSKTAAAVLRYMHAGVPHGLQSNHFINGRRALINAGLVCESEKDAAGVHAKYVTPYLTEAGKDVAEKMALVPANPIGAMASILGCNPTTR